ncbi:uncharacterized protein VICG_00920 [Vittaforma corneae ATCC 50505]|uniref:Fe2OG dioxygenase domain-containing protein n=1 Tax=Vittaforma corneae (strain ATCC 50505) TaxID=993615 RepID=L2GMK9_VITCO|nr:uncharacterized protein VICG_00920 [Vittaforma corneae ATCC 50505]ELA42071.1 hypothetical protein VICG_00920 [Vittaforma corneae ATCC 50505]
MNVTKPFKYEVVDSFLLESELNKIKDIYSTLSFKEVHTDLYNFLQSNELNYDDRFQFFKNKLDNVFKDKVAEKDVFYTLFASYYRKGDFLLCHDDMVDERLYAFTFYLDDFDSGQLVLYENDCETVHKKIGVCSNRLVIFEVEENSFHEVDQCRSSGRKAISGWINSKTKKCQSKSFARSHKVHENVEFFDLNIDIPVNSFVSLEFEDIEVKELSRSLKGPFIDRRVFEIALEKLYTPQLEGYALISAECLLFTEGCYILCNDRINAVMGDILDVYIFKHISDKHNKPSSTIGKADAHSVDGFITYVDQNSNMVFEIDAIGNHMVFGKRNGHCICIHRTLRQVYLKHFYLSKTKLGF